MSRLRDRVAAMTDTGFRPYGKQGAVYVGLADVLEIIDSEDDDHDHEPEDAALGFAGDPAREYPNRAHCSCGIVLMLTDDGWEPE